MYDLDETFDKTYTFANFTDEAMSLCKMEDLVEGDLLPVYSNGKVTIEEVTLSKPDGTATFLPVDPSNLVIIDADLDDDRRIKNKGDN